MIRFAENLNKMIAAGLGGAMEAPSTEVAVGHRVRYMEASGAVANFETNIAAPIRSLRVDMQPIQAGSGDPSPDNIRPITGRDAVTVTRTGKNLLNPAFSAFDLVSTYRAQKMPDTGFTLSIKDKGNGADISGVYFGVTEYGINAKGHVAWLVQNGTIKLAEKYTSAYRYVTIYPTGQETLNKLLARFDIQAEFNTAASAYEPYDGQSVTIQLGQTVYGGTVDATGGKVVTEMGYAVFDGSADEEWTLQSINSKGIANFYTTFNNSRAVENTGICNVFSKQTTQISAITTEGFYNNGQNLFVRIKSEKASTVADFRAWLAENNVQICYELAAPTEFDITPAQLFTRVGENNVWCDAGDVTLEYPHYEETEGY